MSYTADTKIEDRIGYLDGLRGLAIFLVAINHIFYNYNIVQIGWSGLNLFFLLSGYLITKRLYSHYSGSRASYFKNFYGRRILRIFPLYYGCLIIFFLLLPFVYPSYFEFYGDVYDNQVWYWTYTSNWMMVIHGLPEQPIFFHFWSLAVEEQFYVVWPILFLLLVRVKKFYTLIICSLIACSIFLRNHIDGDLASYLSTSTAAEPLLLGALIAMLEKNNRLEKLYRYFLFLMVLSIASLIGILIYNNDLHITNNWLFRKGYTAIDLCWAYLLVVCILNKRGSDFIRGFFNMKWLKWLGKYSYGIYVFHWLILNFFVYKAVRELVVAGIDETAAYFLTRVVGIAAILAISFFSYNFYEKRFLALKKYFYR
jgi:peptidoglycan/LPS O-acetylase OafA/YrhL